MGSRKLGEALVRLLLFCVAVALVKVATVAFEDWQANVASTFAMQWDGWLQWTGSIAGAGFAVGLACLPGRPGRYRPLIPLAVAVPAVLLLGHYVVAVEATTSGGDDLWILDDYFFYMETGAQFVLATVAGLGLAAGLQPRGPGKADAEVAIETPRLP